MKPWHLLFLLLFTSCWMPTQESPSQLQFSGTNSLAGFNLAASRSEFTNVVHPILLQSCQECHGDAREQSPFFALGNALQAHDNLYQSGKVDLVNPNNSRIYQRMVNDRHNCGSISECDELGERMLRALKIWAAAAGAGGRVGTVQTPPLTLADARPRRAHTERGTLVFQAEDGELSNRFVIRQHPLASGGHYITTLQGPPHPLGETEREVVIRDSQCQVPTRAQLEEISNLTSMPVRMRERRRHIDQYQHSFYSNALAGFLIRPDRMTQYLQAVQSAQAPLTLDDLGPYLLRTGREENGELTDNPISVELMRILPDLANHQQWTTQIEQNAQRTDFFAPRFQQGQFYNFNGRFQSELHLLLASSSIRPNEWKQHIFYHALYERYRGFWFNNNRPRRDAGDIPVFIFRTWERGGGVEHYGKNPSDLRPNPNSKRDATAAELEQQAQRFFNHYFAQYINYSNAVGRIDGLLFYTMPGDSREEAQDFTLRYYDQNFSEIRREDFDLNKGDTDLDLTNLMILNPDFGQGEAQIRAEEFEAFHGVIRQQVCINCHGNPRQVGAPKYAVSDVSASYDVFQTLMNKPVNPIVHFDMARVDESYMLRRMDEGHNCEDRCPQIRATLRDALVTWISAVNQRVGQSNGSRTIVTELPYEERVQGIARYPFRVNENDGGPYHIWLKTGGASDQNENFDLRIIDDATGEPVRNCPFNDTECQQRRNANTCRGYGTGNPDSWRWYTFNANNRNNRHTWHLESNRDYTLEIYERSASSGIDMVAISRNEEFNPLENFIDEGFISDLHQQVLSFDLSGALGGPASFEVEVKENNSSSFMFRNPRVKSQMGNIVVQDIKLLLNGGYQSIHHAFNRVDAVVDESNRILTKVPLIALTQNGLNQDQISFAFDRLAPTNDPPTPIEDDSPAPNNMRPCLRQDLFERDVVPILDQTRLILKDEDGYREHTARAPGERRIEVANPVLYTCTTCHNEEHPYFKMTDYRSNPALFCQQALSRVDFVNFNRSLMLRGLNGTFNHPKLHFIERRGASSPNDRWLRGRLDGYTASFMHLNNYSGSERAYLEQFVGQPMRANYQLIDDPFNAEVDGEIQTADDDIAQGIYRGQGQNLYNVINPENFVSNQGALDPSDPRADSDFLALKPSCIGLDPEQSTNDCPSYQQFDQEAEVLKEQYRQVMIRWFRAEDEALRNQN